MALRLSFIVFMVVLGLMSASSAAALPTQLLASTSPTLAPLEDPWAELQQSGAQHVRFDQLVGALDKLADRLAPEPVWQEEYLAFAQSHGLEPRPRLLADFVRVRMIFEATRDGGWWGIRWTITDQMPRSDAIWEQWRTQIFDHSGWRVTAHAECDEISALTSFLLRELGVRGVGLYYPTWNHAVAAWRLPRSGAAGEQARIVIPTTQIFLSPMAGLGTREFGPRIRSWEYHRTDVKDDELLTISLARYLVGQIQVHAHLSAVELQVLRQERGST